MDKATALIFIVLHAVIIIFYGIFTEYNPDASVKSKNENNPLHHVYDMYQDTHVMIFFGFGFLMVFLRRHGFTTTGISFLLAAFCVEWSILTQSFFRQAFSDGTEWVKIQLNIASLVEGDYCGAAILITYGALIGRVTTAQMLVLAFFEVLFYSLNEAIGNVQFGARDIGGSMWIHTFGAYFGLTVSLVLSKFRTPEEKKDDTHATSDYKSDILAMAGTIFLWMYWPSFNAALGEANTQHRVVLNTVMSLVSSCIMTFLITSLVYDSKFNMVEIQNATLAGGVAIGCAGEMQIGVWGAMLTGAVAGTISTLGFRYLSAFLKEKIGLEDTCGVHNLHGMPGLIGGIAGVIAARNARPSNYGAGLGDVFPRLVAAVPRTNDKQAAYQLASIAVTLAIAIGGGIISGVIIAFMPRPEKHYSDDAEWDVPEDFAIHTSMESQKQIDTIPYGAQA